MAKRLGNYRKFCNFAGMKKTLAELIRQNKDLCDILLAQDGGIMKYPRTRNMTRLRTFKTFKDMAQIKSEPAYRAKSEPSLKIGRGLSLQLNIDPAVVLGM